MAAIAVNTDPKFFGCSYEDLTSIRVSDPVCILEEERPRTLWAIVVGIHCRVVSLWPFRHVGFDVGHDRSPWSTGRPTTPLVSFVSPSFLFSVARERQSALTSLPYRVLIIALLCRAR